MVSTRMGAITSRAAPAGAGERVGQDVRRGGSTADRVNHPRGQRVNVGEMTDEDAELLRALHAEHGEALFTHTLRLTHGDRQQAEDLFQETLVRAWRQPHLMS